MFTYKLMSAVCAVALGGVMGASMAFQDSEPVKASQSRDFMHIVGDTTYSCPTNTSDFTRAVAAKNLTDTWTLGTSGCGVTGSTVYVQGLVIARQGSGSIINDGGWESSDPSSGDSATSFSVVSSSCYGRFSGSTLHLSTNSANCGGSSCDLKVCVYNGSNFD